MIAILLLLYIVGIITFYVQIGIEDYAYHNKIRIDFYIYFLIPTMAVGWLVGYIQLIGIIINKISDRYG